MTTCKKDDPDPEVTAILQRGNPAEVASYDLNWRQMAAMFSRTATSSKRCSF